MTNKQITKRFALQTLFPLSFLLCFNASAQELSEAHPILAFSFDNVTSSVVADDSGSGNIYSIEADDINGPFTPSTGKSFHGSGKAMNFDGFKQERIEISGTSLTLHAFTIMADVRLRNPPRFTDPANQRWEISEKAGSYWANIRVDQGPVRPGPPYLLRVGGFFDGIGDSSFSGATGVIAGPWQNVAFVFDNVGHTLTSYINGILDHTQPRDGELSASVDINGIDENLVVGAKDRLGGASRVLDAFFDGQMDNYRLYNRALTASQIARVAGTPVIVQR